MILARSVRHGLSLVAVACLLGMAVGSSDNGAGTSGTGSSASSNQWFSGGTLQNATVAEWRAASYQNKLATAGDWLASTKWMGHLNSPSDFDRLKLKAQKLVIAVDEVVTVKETNTMQVNEIAASLITMSYDLGP